eukprot:5774484-Amphidinium_carterae.1
MNQQFECVQVEGAVCYVPTGAMVYSKGRYGVPWPSLLGISILCDLAASVVLEVSLRMLQACKCFTCKLAVVWIEAVSFGVVMVVCAAKQEVLHALMIEVRR